MPKQSNGETPSDKLAFYDRLVATGPAVERKGAAMPYTSVGGHMFSFLTKDGTFALRLPDEEREAFLKKYRARLCEQHGTVMKEYVLVPADLLMRTRELAKYFAASYAYAASLKPKAATRKNSIASTGGKTVAARRIRRS